MGTRYEVAGSIKRMLIVTGLAALCTCWILPASGAGWPEVFDPFQPRVLHLEMATQDWDRVRFDQPSQSEDWVPEVAQAWMREEGGEPLLVAVRRKGESDLALPSETDPRKVSLKIDINEYVAGQTWRDLKKLSLENGSASPLNEGFAWIVHRQAAPFYGYPASLSGWVRLFINGEEAGLYTSAEQRDETFLRNHDIYSPTCTWLYKVDGTTELEIGVSNSPAYLNLQFSPFNSGPGGNKPPSVTTAPEFDTYLPNWVNMEALLTLAACHAFTENSDALFTHDGKNTFCVDFDPPYPRTRRYYPWDLDTGMKDGNMSIYVSGSYAAILDHPWFGRVYEHILHELLDGPLSESALGAMLDRMEAGLAAACLSDPYVYPEGAAGEFAGLRAWTAARAASIRSQFRHPFVPRPALSLPGGEVALGTAVYTAVPTGTVYYTLDGSDPRLPGGATSPSALAWTAPLLIDMPVHVTARTLVGTNWSGLATTAYFTIARHGSDLRVTEIMYNPLDVDTSDSVDNDAYEYIEFLNTGSAEIDLSAFYCEGITFTFTNGFKVAAGGYVVLVRNPAAFSARYPGAPYHGVYLGKLSNDGEKIRLLRPDGTTVVSVEYDDDPPWVISPDGMGFSLVNMEVDGNPDVASHWRASAALFGSPGSGDPLPVYSTSTVINEVLVHTDPPLEDAIELHNESDVPVDIGGWFLSDAARDAAGNLDASLLRKYRIPDGTVLGPRGFWVCYAQAFNGPEAFSPFGLSENGEHVYLSAADAVGHLLGHVVAVKFPACENGVSYGRVQTVAGPLNTMLAARTFGADAPTNLTEFRTGGGATNAMPRVGPVVVNEIMYHPPTNLTEFVELHNLLEVPVDLSGWMVSGAGGFTFPDGASIASGGFVLIVETSRVSVAEFQAERGVPAGCPIYAGAFSLDNGGERLTVLKPNSSLVDPMYPVDSVRYNDKPLWPTEADGGGPSLERYVPSAFGDDPLNWRTSRTGGSPGATNRFNAGLSVTAGSHWKYWAGPASLDTAWRAVDYADSVWPDGWGPFGYGEIGLGTDVPYGNDVTNRYVTTYFRKTFSLAEVPSSLLWLKLEAMYDDGFVAYLNGVEVARRSLPDGEIAYGTLAFDHESAGYETLELGTNGIALLRQGLNVLAVAVHQADAASQDLVWDARLTYATPEMLVAADPVFSPSGQRFIDPLTVTLTCPTPDAEIYYTLDGQTPEVSSVRYEVPVVLAATSVLKARAYALGYAASGVTTALYERIAQDGDADGLPDDWELTHFGSIEAVTGAEDSDQDSVPNADEFVCGTDPADPNSVPQLFIENQNGVLRVRFATIPTDRNSLAYKNAERYYSLQYAQSLTNGAVFWSLVPSLSDVLGDGVDRDYVVTPDSPGGFYKLVIRLIQP